MGLCGLEGELVDLLVLSTLQHAERTVVESWAVDVCMPSFKMRYSFCSMSLSLADQCAL